MLAARSGASGPRRRTRGRPCRSAAVCTDAGRSMRSSGALRAARTTNRVEVLVRLRELARALGLGRFVRSSSSDPSCTRSQLGDLGVGDAIGGASAPRSSRGGRAGRRCRAPRRSSNVRTAMPRPIRATRFSRSSLYERLAHGSAADARAPRRAAARRCARRGAAWPSRIERRIWRYASSPGDEAGTCVERSCRLIGVPILALRMQSHTLDHYTRPYLRLGPFVKRISAFGLAAPGRAHPRLSAS